MKKGSDLNTNQRLVDVSSYIIETDYDKYDPFFLKSICLCTTVLSFLYSG